MKARPDDVAYYAQLLRPRAGHPTARVLICRILRVLPSGHIRLKHPSTVFGLRAHPDHITTDPAAAQSLLRSRVIAAINQHHAEIRNLRLALKNHNQTATIAFARRVPRST